MIMAKTKQYLHLVRLLKAKSLIINLINEKRTQINLLNGNYLKPCINHFFV